MVALVKVPAHRLSMQLLMVCWNGLTSTIAIQVEYSSYIEKWTLHNNYNRSANQVRAGIFSEGAGVIHAQLIFS